ncbi:MAG: hypothetical protein ABFC94_19045 [Syntrophomonas sp.]
MNRVYVKSGKEKDRVKGDELAVFAGALSVSVSDLLDEKIENGIINNLRKGDN